MPSGAQIIAAAEQYTGVPYSQHNPQSPSTGLDCSGMVQLALENLGINVPRTTGQQLAAAQSGQVGVDIGTNLANAQPGDIIHYPDHEEVWLGNGQVFSEATWGTRAAVRGRDPMPITGIVRYTGTASGGINLAADTSSIDPITSFEDWSQSVATRTGLVIMGALLVLLGLILFGKDTGMGKDLGKAAKMAAVV